MKVEKKQILKDDGRYLVYYHFPETATPEQSAAFSAADRPPVEASKNNDGDPEAAEDRSSH